ncbi:MAG: glycoside hydrolase family 15 protein [Solirubrobacterales bacterium]|nr:glycoside hydrolase family 15 protein [Solirubrobacterales bacterium]
MTDSLRTPPPISATPPTSATSAAPAAGLAAAPAAGLAAAPAAGPGGPAGYLPIGEHGIIGDLHTAALVGSDGTIDWFCPDRFDGPSVFGALLDRNRGGHYRIAPEDRLEGTKQLYLPETNVLITRFLSPEGVSEIQDFMPVGGGPQRLIRSVVGIRGALRFRVEVEPRFGYGLYEPQVALEPAGAVFRARGHALALGSPVALERTAAGVAAEFRLAAGERLTFVLQSGEEAPRLDAREAERLGDETVRFWRSWLRQSSYRGRWREMVDRSALTLKLLSYEPSGAIVAAPTTGLPERIGGTRNWDYRYAWVRDFAFSIYALSRLGFAAEAVAFNGFRRKVSTAAAVHDGGSPLNVMYRIDGGSCLTEHELTHLEGYRGSRPVRIGNGAATQLQLDVYGDLFDSIYIAERQALGGHGELIAYDDWISLVPLIEWVCDHWQEPDNGIWETRGGRKRFTHSHLMCWVALDRAIRIATNRGLPADLSRWTRTRDEIFAWVMAHGWSERRRAFVQAEGSDVLDASLLLMPLVHFIAPTDPRWLSTLRAIGSELVSDSLVYRYDPASAPDGLEGEEGTFSMCSFWYVECLARAGHLEEAQLAFEKMLTYANHLGLYSEQIGSSGELLGNFPQAFTHLALISAATRLDLELQRWHPSRTGTPRAS